MTKQFRVGDKVRVIKEFCEHKVGKVAVIRIVDNNDPDYTYGLVGGGWIDGDSIEIVKEDASMTKYKTVKRKANVGERILITDADITFGDYKNGEVLTVTSEYHGYGVRVTCGGLPCIFHREYEVIVDEPKRKKPKRIDVLEARVTELEAQLAELSAKKPVATSFNPAPTPNEQRKATIERAKAFVADLEKRAIGDNSNTDGNALFNHRTTRVSFHVNAEKRVVTALAHGKYNGQLLGKAFAKCAPDDVFNADIGKAIAAGRLYGVDVSEFENAVKPTEVTLGMVVNGHEVDGFYSPDKCFKLTKPKERYSDAFYYDDENDYIFRKQIGDILDDTAAQY